MVRNSCSVSLTRGEERPLDHRPADLQGAVVALGESTSGEETRCNGECRRIERAKVTGQQGDLLQFAGRAGNLLPQGGQAVKTGWGQGFAGREGGGRPGGVDFGTPQGQFQLVGLAERPRFHPALSQIGGERSREAMERQHALGLDQLHIAHQIGVIRMIAEGKCGVALVAIGRTRIERPAGQHRSAAMLDAGQHQRAIGAGWTDQHLAIDLPGGVVDIAAGEPRI